MTILCTLKSLALREEIATDMDTLFGIGKVPLHYSFHATMAKRLDTILTCAVMLLHEPFNEHAPALRYYIEQYINLTSRRMRLLERDNETLSIKRLQRQKDVLEQFLKRVDARHDETTQQQQQDHTAMPSDLPFSVPVQTHTEYPVDNDHGQVAPNGVSADVDLGMVDYSFDQWADFFGMDPMYL